MKVLHIVRALDVGGLERVVLDLVEGCRSHGVESHIACLHHAGTWGEGRDDLTVLSGNSKFTKAVSLARFARRLGVDVLHSHNPEPHMVAVLAHLLSSIPVVHTKHGRNYPKNRRRVWLNSLLSMLSNKVVCISDDAMDVAVRVENVAAEKATVIRNGVRIHGLQRWQNGIDGPRRSEESIEIRKSLRLTDDHVLIGSVGRLSPEKNYGLLVSAFAELKRIPRERGTEPDYALVFVGDGPERGELEGVVASLGLGDCVHFAGMRDSVPAWLGALDVFCLSSTTEGTSITLLEACSVGLPAVVSAVGGNGEIIAHGVSGYVVSSGNVRAFAEALFALTTSPPLRSAFGQSARGRVECVYCIGKMVASYGAVYRAVCGAKGMPNDG